MILPTDRILSTVWHITYIYWMLVWMISQVLPIISVLSCLACPYTSWKRMILHNDQLLLSTCYINYIYIYIACLNEWYRVLSIINVLSYFTSSHALYTLKTNDLACWSIVCYILCVCMNDLACLVNHMCVVLLQMSICISKTNDHTHWSTFIYSMIYEMYILGVCMNDLACIVNHKCVILLCMSLYTLQTNDLTP